MRRILQEIEEAKLRAERVAKGMAGTLRIGFMETVSWHGVLPDGSSHRWSNNSGRQWQDWHGFQAERVLNIS